VAGAEVLVRRLAFTRAGDDLQRLTAAKILAEQGLIDPDDKLKMWIGQRQIIATLDILSQKYKAEAARDRTGERNYDQATALMLNEALEAMRLGDADKAISLYTRILDKNPRVKQAYQNLAALLSGKGEVERAISYIQQALRVDYEYVHAQIALAQLWLAAGDLEKTEAQLESLETKLAGYYVDELDAYYYVKLSLFRKQEKFAEMAEVARKLVELDPENKIALEVLAQKPATSDQNPSPTAPASGES
jgi:tetratricopeptide (TPR) repeat protein